MAKSPAELLEPGRPLTISGVADGAEGLVVADLARTVAARTGAPATSLVVICRDGPRMAALMEALPQARIGGYADTAEALAPLIAAALHAGDIVLVKGSNGSRMRNVAAALTALGVSDAQAAIDPNIVRGLEYYTGAVFEAQLIGEGDGNIDNVRMLRRAAEAKNSDPKVKRNLALVLGLQGKHDAARQIAALDATPAVATADADHLRRTVKAEPQPIVAVPVVLAKASAAEPALPVVQASTKAVAKAELVDPDAAAEGDRSGVGLRLGANVGYLKFTSSPTWNPL